MSLIFAKWKAALLNNANLSSGLEFPEDMGKLNLYLVNAA